VRNPPGHREEKQVEQQDMGIGILKMLWGRQKDGRWGITSMKGLDLKPQAGADPKFFRYESQMALLTNRPRGTIEDILSSFGPTDFLMKQSILPVVAWMEGDSAIRCIGTATVISCSGLVMTACHVLLDPVERKYGKVVRQGDAMLFGPELNRVSSFQVARHLKCAASDSSPLSDAGIGANGRKAHSFTSTTSFNT
jgi:hypothetical protein